MAETASRPTDPDAVASAGVVTLFGFPPSAVVAHVLHRSRAWRVGGAVRTVGAFLVVAPIVAIVPPHAPWAIGALVGGALLARRRLTERHTLVALRGRCPKCDEPLASKKARLRLPHPVTCEHCHHVGSLSIPDLDVRAPGTG